jgi:alpha-1,6-mannosyltransferase
LIYHQDPVAVYPHTLFDRWLPHTTIDRLSEPYWAYVRALSSRFDVTVVAGDWLAHRLKSFGVAHASSVPFGIDRDLFSPDKADLTLRADLLARCGVSSDAALFVVISRHHPEKRLHTLLEAFRQVRRQRSAGLVVFGDGPLRAWVERSSERVGGVHIAGLVRDREWLARALASADALLHGSAAETFGFVVAEALCSGLPIVAPNRGGAAELLSPTYSETYNPGDAQECARAALRILFRPRHELSAAAVASAAQRVCSVDQHFDDLFALYARLRVC